MKRIGVLVGLILLLTTGLSRAETRWIIPAAPGMTDSLARTLSTALAERGERVTIENKPGGGGVIGMNVVAQSSGDTLGFVSVSMATLAPHLSPALAEVMEQLEPVVYVGDTGLMLVARGDSPITDFRALLAHAKTTKTPYGHLGAGTLAHVAGSLMEKQENVQLTPVGYKGSVAIIQDILGGHIPVGFVGITTAMPFIKEGKLRVIGTSGLSSAQLAALGVPSYGQQGFPTYDGLGGGFLIMANRSLNKERKQRMRENVEAVLRKSEVVSQLAGGGVYVRDNAAPEALYQAWRAQWKAYLGTTGLVALKH